MLRKTAKNPCSNCRSSRILLVCIRFALSATNTNDFLYYNSCYLICQVFFEKIYRFRPKIFPWTSAAAKHFPLISFAAIKNAGL